MRMLSKVETEARATARNAERAERAKMTDDLHDLWMADQDAAAEVARYTVGWPVDQPKLDAARAHKAATLKALVDAKTKYVEETELPSPV